MIHVKKVIWIDEDSGEADVILTDGTYSIECFCSNCELSEGNEFSDALYGFTVKNVMKDFNADYVIDKEADGYHICGQLVAKEFLQVGEFKIDISDGDIPKDIEQNDHIEVDVSRVDIF